MKKILYLFLFTVFNFCHSELSQNHSGAIKLELENKGAYFADAYAEGQFYLIEASLINYTDSAFSLIAYTCLSNSIFMTSDQEFEICANACSGNYPTIIEMAPSEECSFSIILHESQKDLYTAKPLKIGIILLKPRKDMFRNKSFRETIEEMKRKKENILWSNEILLEPAGGKTYRIIKHSIN